MSWFISFDYCKAQINNTSCIIMHVFWLLSVTSLLQIKQPTKLPEGSGYSTWGMEYLGMDSDMLTYYCDQVIIHSCCIIRRGIPDKVHPFSKGICRNIYVFCFSRQKGYDLEEVPPLEELEARAAPYTCRDIICCRCCWSCTCQYMLLP